MLFFGCEYCFQIPELDLEIIELRSNLAKKELYSFKKITSTSDTSDFIVFNYIDLSREIYFDKENLNTIYFDSFEPSEKTQMSNNNYNFVFGRLFQDEVMSCLLQDPKLFKLRKEVSYLYFEYTFGLHCRFFHYVEDSAVTFKLNYSHIDKKNKPLNKISSICDIIKLSMSNSRPS